MELLEHLRRQFAYDDWANKEVLAAIKAETADLPSPSLHLLAHILSAERLWLERLRQQPQTMPVWPPGTLDECEIQLAELSELWKRYFDRITAPALEDTIAYKNSKGEAWSSSVLDVLTHITMHSAYHRGQIASLMRAAGGTPAYTDFIHAVRQSFVK